MNVAAGSVGYKIILPSQYKCWLLNFKQDHQEISQNDQIGLGKTMIYTKIGKQITIYDKIGPKLVVIVEQGISKELPGQNKIKEWESFWKATT